MKQRIWGRAFIGGSIRNRTLITIEDGQIAEIREAQQPPEDALVTHDLIVPGFVDLHVHGGDGADFMDGAEEAAARVSSFHARNGTTAMAATTLSGSSSDLRVAVAAIARVSRSQRQASEICGIHLEGPYISAKRAGAQN